MKSQINPIKLILGCALVLGIPCSALALATSISLVDALHEPSVLNQFQQATVQDMAYITSPTYERQQQFSEMIKAIHK